MSHQRQLKHAGITGIQQAPIMICIPTLSKTHDFKDEQAWSLIHNFATTNMTLPNAETALKTLWGDGYVEEKWWPALKAVMDAKNDILAALSAIKKIQLTTSSDTSLVAAKVLVLPPVRCHTGLTRAPLGILTNSEWTGKSSSHRSNSKLDY